MRRMFVVLADQVAAVCVVQIFDVIAGILRIFGSAASCRRRVAIVGDIFSV